MKLLLIPVILLLISASSAMSDTVEGTSVYQYEAVCTDQNGQQTAFADLQGDVQLVAFVYTYCEHTCPLIVAQIKSILHSLPDTLDNPPQVTLISLDPQRDTPAQMKAYMKKNQLSEETWTMLAAEPEDVRVLSNLFDVKYRAMRKDELIHSNVVTVLDRNGVIQYQQRGLNEEISEITALITGL